MTQAELRQQLLDYLKKAEDDNHGKPRILQLAWGLDGQQMWGHYEPTARADLEGREYEVIGPKGHDEKPAILWLDVKFDPRTKKYEPAAK